MAWEFCCQDKSYCVEEGPNPITYLWVGLVFIVRSLPGGFERMEKGNLKLKIFQSNLILVDGLYGLSSLDVISCGGFMGGSRFKSLWGQKPIKDKKNKVRETRAFL